MNRITLALLSGALAAALPANPLPAQAPNLARVQAVADSLAGAYVAQGVLPGLTVAVAHRGEIAFVRGYGTADLEQGVPAGPETVYGVTSITKQLVAAAVLRLADAGRLSLDDSVSKHLPDFPLQGRPVTVRHLLGHTSGIFPLRSFSSLPDTTLLRRDLGYAQMVELFGAQPFEFEPGERWAYNNLGYYLLGEIVSRVTGTPWGEHVERELAALGIHHTVFCDQNRLVPHRARPYEARRAGGFANARWISLHIFGASGAFCSTAGDLVRWTHLLFGGQVVSPASLRGMTTPGVLADGRPTGYGYGLYVGELAGHRRLHHGGTSPWGAYLSHYPDDGLTVVVLTNAAGVGRERGAELEEALARAAFGIEIPDLPMAAEEAARYEGTYALQLPEGRTLDLRVFVEDGVLKAQAAGQRAARLRSQGGHAFLHETDSGIRMVFTLEDGRAASVTLHQNGGVFPGPRKP